MFPHGDDPGPCRDGDDDLPHPDPPDRDRRSVACASAFITVAGASVALEPLALDGGHLRRRRAFFAALSFLLFSGEDSASSVVFLPGGLDEGGDALPPRSPLGDRPRTPLPPAGTDGLATTSSSRECSSSVAPSLPSLDSPPIRRMPCSSRRRPLGVLPSLCWMGAPGDRPDPARVCFPPAATPFGVMLLLSPLSRPCFGSTGVDAGSGTDGSSFCSPGGPSSPSHLRSR